MPDVSQRDSTAVPPEGEVSARHTNHLRSIACDLGSLLDRGIRQNQLLGQPAFAAFALGDTHMFKLRRSVLDLRNTSIARLMSILLVAVCLGGSIDKDSQGSLDHKPSGSELKNTSP